MTPESGSAARTGSLVTIQSMCPVALRVGYDPFIQLMPQAPDLWPRMQPTGMLSAKSFISTLLAWPVDGLSRNCGGLSPSE